MSKTWRFHSEVAEEVEATARWYEKERAGLGVEFALAVNAVIATLARAGYRVPQRSSRTVRSAHGRIHWSKNTLNTA